MTQKKHWAAIATLALLLTGCSETKDTVPDSPPQNIYATAKQKLQDGNYRAAIKQLEALDNRYPFGPYAQQVQLDLIYAYYKNDDLALCQATITRFIHLSPTHPNIDYVLYMRGLTDMKMDEPAIQHFLGIDRSDRDPTSARLAFSDFTQLIQSYPKSVYAPDARARLIALKDRLANYELSIVEYYTQRGAYVAVVNRVEGMLRNFPDTQATHHALPLMEKAYRKLQLGIEADKVAKIIAANSK